MSERAISDPSQHGWVEVDGKWMWAAGSGGGSIQDGDTDGQITTWDGTEWTPSDDMTVNSGIMKLFDRGSGDGELRLFHEDDATTLLARGSAGSAGTFSISTSDGGTASERMSIDADGNVGIGTDSVTNPYGGTEYTDVNIDGVWGGALSFKLGGEEQGWIGQRNSGAGAMMIGASAGKSLHFSTDGNKERMSIAADGAVNVTSSTDTTKLNITNSVGTYELTNNEYGSLAINYNDTERFVLASNGDVYISGKLFVGGEEVGAGGGGGLWTDNGDGSISYSGTAKATDFVTT